jgi:hypothetical protein
VAMVLFLTRVWGARAFPKRFTLFCTDPSIQEGVGGLLQSVLSRSQRTTITDKSSPNQQPFSDNADSDNWIEYLSVETSVDGLLKLQATQGQSMLDEKKDHEALNQSLPSALETKAPKKLPSLIYNGNLAITNTALAHSLWLTIASQY